MRKQIVTLNNEEIANILVVDEWTDKFQLLLLQWLRLYFSFAVVLVGWLYEGV